MLAREKLCAIACTVGMSPAGAITTRPAAVFVILQRGSLRRRHHALAGAPD